MRKQLIALALAAGFWNGIASAQTTYQAFLSGSQEVGPNASPATGFGTVVLNAAQTQITVDESWTGLTAPATASHIHGPAGVGTNASVLFPFSGVPAATSGAIPEQTFAITPTQVGYLQSGLLYMNVHDANFPGGEIRGQLTLVPEPGTWALFGLGSLGLAWVMRRRAK
jgi:CHRD domain-containing protein/PEP-CTERM motif-containing protein